MNNLNCLAFGHPKSLAAILLGLLALFLPDAPLFSEGVSADPRPWAVDAEAGLTVGRFEVPSGSTEDLVTTILSIRGGGSFDLKIPINDLWSYGPQLGLYSIRFNDVPLIDLPVGAFVQMGSSGFFLRFRANYILSTTFTGGPLIGAQATLGPFAFSWDYVFAPYRYSRLGLSLFFPDVWTFAPLGSKETR